VETRIHGLVADEHLVVVALDRLRELRMLGEDEHPPVVGVRGIEERQVDVVEGAPPRRTSEAAATVGVGDPRLRLPLLPTRQADKGIE
jgi:hypothetical protein